MKKFYLFLRLPLLQCEQSYEESIWDYRFKIALYEEHNGIQTAAMLYFYDRDMNLISYRNSLAGEEEVQVTRTGNTIVLGYRHYCSLDTSGRIVAYTRDTVTDLFTWSGKELVHCSTICGEWLIRESFYSRSGNLVFDSTLLYSSPGNVANTIMARIRCTGTLRPAAKVHHTGLVNYPAVTGYLIGEIESEYYSSGTVPDSVCIQKYQYITDENYISEYLDIYDGSGDLLDQRHSVYNRIDIRDE